MYFGCFLCMPFGWSRIVMERAYCLLVIDAFAIGKVESCLCTTLLR